MKKPKKLFRVRSETEARELWSRADSKEYLDWSKAQISFFPSLKLSSRTISIRLPEPLLERIKILANRQDVPYQSMLKILLADKVRELFNAKKDKSRTA